MIAAGIVGQPLLRCAEAGETELTGGATASAARGRRERRAGASGWRLACGDVLSAGGRGGTARSLGLSERGAGPRELGRAGRTGPAWGRGSGPVLFSSLGWEGGFSCVGFGLGSLLILLLFISILLFLIQTNPN